MHKNIDLEDFAEIVDLLDSLPEKDGRRAAGLLKLLYDHESANEHSNVKQNKANEVMQDYPFLKIKDGISESHLRSKERRGKEIAQFFCDLLDDHKLKPDFKRDAGVLMAKHVPSWWFLWRIDHASKGPQKRGPKTDIKRNDAIYELVIIFHSTLGKFKPAYKKVSEALKCIRRSLSDSQVRSIYENTRDCRNRHAAEYARICKNGD